MRIAVDAWELGGRPTGVGRYLRALLLRVAVPDAGLRRTCSSCSARPGAGPSTAGRSAPEARVSRHRWSVAPDRGRTRWEQWDLPRALGRADRRRAVRPGLQRAAGSARVPVVLTVHDVSFAAHPEWFRLARTVAATLVDQARGPPRRDTVVTDSNVLGRRRSPATSRVEPSRIAVVPLGAPFLSCRRRHRGEVPLGVR